MTGALDAVVTGAGSAAEQLDRLGGESVRTLAGLGTALRFGLTGLAALLPDPHLKDVAQFVGFIWDGIVVVRRGLELSGWSLWAARLGSLVGFGSAIWFAWQAWTARRRADRIWCGLQAAGNLLTAVGVATAGAELVTAGAASAEVPPVGVALVVVGATLLAGACLYREWGWLTGGGAVRQMRTGVRWVRAEGTRAAGAVHDASRSVADALNPF